ncbi:MAG: RecQ family zinc-binding domain-containing protein [Isosphaeraceae bacterium]
MQRIVLLGLEGLVNGRWGEPVYFHPDDLAASLGLDRPALNRAIKALSSELPVDYVPPFPRERCAGKPDRRRRPRELGIDFAALKQRKDREYDKLERMIQYAQTRKCRRAFLLEYRETRDRDVHWVKRCDNCGETPAQRRARNERARIVPRSTPRPSARSCRKTLSGVARAKVGSARTSSPRCSRGSGRGEDGPLGLKN